VNRTLWTLAAVCALVLIVTVVLVGQMHSGRGRSVGGGWHLRKPGSWPWGAGSDSANGGGYVCVIPKGHVERWDTLLGSTYTTAGSAVCTLRVWTLIRFGSAAPTVWSRATCRIVASTDDGQTWQVLRDYGHRDFTGHETIGMPPWATGKPRLRLAWACHVYDSTNLRYWCFDKVGFTTTDRPNMDCGITEVAFPRSGRALPPLEEIPVIVTVTNAGMQADDSTRLSVAVDSGYRGYADTVLAVHYDQRQPVELRLPWSDEDTGRFTLTLRLDGIRWDQIPENDTMTVGFEVRANCWQLLDNEYPYPRSLVTRGFAAAGASDGTLYVRNPDAPDGTLTAYSPVRDEWRQLPVRGSRVQRAGRGPPRLSSGVVDGDTSIYFLVDDGKPLVRYDIKQGRWHETSSQGSVGVGRGIDGALADGICVDETGRMFVLGKRHVFAYAPSEDKWSVLGDSSPFEWAAPCGDHQGCAYLNGILFTVLSDGRVVGCGTDHVWWSQYDSLPSFDSRGFCRMAADPENSTVYFLSGSGLKNGVVFAALDVAGDSWLLDLPQPFAGSGRQKIRPGAQLVRAGRWLYAVNGGSNEVWAYNLPAARWHRSRSGRW
jgi:hypothetical protein